MLKTPFYPPATTLLPQSPHDHKGEPVTTLPIDWFILKSQALICLSNEQLTASLLSVGWAMTFVTDCLWPYKDCCTVSELMSIILIEQSSDEVRSLVVSSVKQSDRTSLWWGFMENRLSFLTE
jgi:hypothetical protein